MPHSQEKKLKVTTLVSRDEFHPGGFLFTIFDNDGSTILKEWWEANQPIGIQMCRNWLKIRAGEDLDYSEINIVKEISNAKSE